MFKFNQLKSIHLEISNNCQASCPMCTRNVHGGLPNPLLEIENWTLERFQKVITPEVVKQIQKLYFCGNFGDPILNAYLPNMCDYATQIDPTIQIRIHTNGSARSPNWWRDLASKLPKDHAVIFAIDGLQDTHAIYRIGTDFDMIIKNAQAFIAAGGNAEWAFLRFKHNEHQVDQAREMAKQLGFSTFTMKDSSRFVLDSKFPVWNKQGETSYYLEPSQYSKITFITKKDVDNYRTLLEKVEIDCYVKQEKEIYLDAKGHLLPCCWISSLPYQYIEHDGDLIPARIQIREQYHALVNSLGGLQRIDIEQHSLKEIIDSHEYQTVWNHYWNKDKLITCARICGKSNSFSNPNDQFVSQDYL